MTKPNFYKIYNSIKGPLGPKQQHRCCQPTCKPIQNPMRRSSGQTINLTFDYEMFSGKPGTVENNMLLPTEKLLKTFREYKMQSTFFVETVFLLKLLKLSKKYKSLEKDFFLIKKQLQQMIIDGHRIELHLHPYWLDGTYDGFEWKIESYRYNRLQSMREEKAIDLFASSAQLLESIASEVDPNYKLCAFRAGGWCIEPFDVIKKCFKKTGIFIDSSVAPGIKKESHLYIADFTNVNPEKDFYYFDDTPTKEINYAPDKNYFLEIPITTIKTNYIYKIKNKIFTYKNKNLFKKFGDGIPVPENKNKTKYKKSFRTMLTLEGNASPEALIGELKKLPNEKKIFTFISHPKCLTQNSFKILDALYKTNSYKFITPAFGGGLVKK
jgi:hypothetical protein